MAVSLAAEKYGTETCERTWQKIGCFNDKIIPNRPLPDELLNRRDPINNNWDGKILNWRDYGTTLHALACRCAALAKERGHKVFALQFYGECWSGDNALYLFARDGKAKDEDCIGIDYKTCDDNAETECVGKAFKNYIYKLNEDRSDDKKIDGNWSDWSSWTPCSQTCGRGGQKSRERVCNNPEPANGGAQCEGEGEAVASCNEEACQPVCRKELDVGIILDGSSSVTRSNWDKTLEFVQTFAKEFEISEQGVHFGVLHFSWKVYMDFLISDQRYWQQEALNEKVSTISYPYGGTRTDLALNAAKDQFFCNECTNRNTVPKVLLVVTDGKSSYNAKSVKDASQPLKDESVTIITIGIGSADRTELEEMATDESHVFMLEQYTYLKDKLNSLLKLTCQSVASKRR